MVAVPEDLQHDLDSAYRAHFPTLYRRARRWLPADEAEDLVQETFLRAWRHHGGRDPGIAWLMTVLRNLAIDRSRRIKPDLVEDITTVERETADDTADTVVALEDRRRIRDAVRSLTDSQQQALHMKEWMGLSQEEIARTLGTTVPAVESLLLRGRRRLRVLLEGAMGVAVWPVAFVWRRVRISEQMVATSGAGQAAASAYAGTLATVATAAIIAVGAMSSPSAPSSDERPDRAVPVFSDTQAREEGPVGALVGGPTLTGDTGGTGRSVLPATGGSAGSSGTVPTADTTGTGSTDVPASGTPADGSGDTGSTGSGSGDAPPPPPATDTPPDSGGTGSTSSDTGWGSGGGGTVAPPPADDGSGKDPGGSGSGSGGSGGTPPPASSDEGTVTSDTGGTGGGSEQPPASGSSGSGGGTGSEGPGTGGETPALDGSSDGGGIGLGGF
ncbi:MAG TPA: sigma-70 family RNA polymerase sigma factor [Actinomycetota bacterium]